MANKPTAIIAPTATPRDRIERIRAALMPDEAFEWEVAEALGKSRRSVQRLGLPYRKYGATRVYDIPGSRKKLRRQSPLG